MRMITFIRAVVGGLVMLLVSDGGASLSLTAQDRAADVVQQLRGLPTSLSPGARSDGSVDSVELRRTTLYRELMQLGPEGGRALAEALREPDVGLRRNVALALAVLAGEGFEPARERLDIRAQLPALLAALRDEDHSVRARVAQAIGGIGPDAAPAVPALITLLKNTEESSRNSACIALYGIGAAATDALPALREALADRSTDVRRFAQRAIEKIEGRR
jgi:HEAT repeat protein